MRSARVNRKPAKIAERSKPSRKFTGALPMIKPRSVQPGPTLKALRNRAGVSSAVCAKALGLNGPSGFARYENEKRFLTDPIPYKVIDTIRPHLVGRGVPPVTDDELWAISEVKDLKGLLPKVSQLVNEFPAQQTTYAPSAVARTLETKYRAELGVYSTLGTDTPRKFQNAPILPAATFPTDAQFAVAVGDDHAAEFGIRAEAFVHCLDVGLNPVTNGCVVLAARKVQGFYEVLFARVTGGTPSAWQLSQRDVGNFSGAVLGVAYKVYTSVA